MTRAGALHRLLGRDALVLATVGVAVVNGLPVTPMFDSVSYVLYLFTRGSSVVGQDALLYLTSAFMAALTLLLAGIPAALWERVRGLRESTLTSLSIWLIATLALASPTLLHLTGLR